MEQERQDIESRQERGEMLLAVSKVVFQVVALGFQGIVILIFHFPARPTGKDDLCDRLIGEGVIGSEGIFVGNFAIRAGEGEFTPVDL